jgi:hypothetical protein
MKSIRVNFTRQITFALVLGLSLSSASQASSVNADRQKSSIKPGDIKSWTYFDPLWAGGLDANGKLLAIYDLSYPTFKDRIELGLFDPSIENYDRVLNALSSNDSQDIAVSHKRESDLVKAIEWMKNYKRDLNLVARGAQNVLPSQWWQTIPWKSDRFASLTDAPEHFYLSDIDFTKLVKNQKQFNQRLKKMGGSDFLQQFEYKKELNGAYRIFWNPPGDVAGSTAAVTPPQKMVDFTCYKCGLWDAITWDGMSMLINAIVSEIPLPVVSGLLAVGFREFFQFHRELMIAHQSMALEMIRTAEEGTARVSPFAGLSTDNREFAAGYLMLAKSTLMSSFEWIFLNPRTQWAKQEQNAIKRAADATTYLEGKGEVLTPLNARFAMGVDANQGRNLYMTGADRFVNIFPPFSAIDYVHPQLVRDLRIGVELGHILVTFISPYIPITGVGSALTLMYEDIIEKAMEDIQHWEARLSAHLQGRKSAGEEWTLELNRLYLQTINPFEVPPANAADLISKRKAAINPL